MRKQTEQKPFHSEEPKKPQPAAQRTAAAAGLLDALLPSIVSVRVRVVGCGAAASTGSERGE